jgi:hypothetical protein
MRPEGWRSRSVSLYFSTPKEVILEGKTPLLGRDVSGGERGEGRGERERERERERDVRADAIYHDVQRDKLQNRQLPLFQSLPLKKGCKYLRSLHLSQMNTRCFRWSICNKISNLLNPKLYHLQQMKKWQLYKRRFHALAQITRHHQ